MDRGEAERLYDSGKQLTVEKLLEYDRENGQLKQRIARLETTSQSSSKPPSTDSPSAREGRSPSCRKRSRKRKAGGQPGHRGSKRALLPPEEVDKVIPCYPSECVVCPDFPECSSAEKTAEPFRWQVTEIQPITPTVTEYQVHALSGRCGEMHRGSVPEEAARSNFGPRLIALCAYCTAVLHLPRRLLKDCLRTVFGVQVALGSTQNLLRQTSDALAPIDQQLRKALPQQEVINADESGWYQRWIWIFVTKGFIYFHIAASRSSTVLVELLGKIYEGILCVDRWGAYTRYHLRKDHQGLLQICWAHLKRDILGIKEVGNKTGSRDARAFARRMEYLRKRLMALWHAVKAGTRTRKWLRRKAARLQSSIRRCLEDFQESSDPTVRSFARRLLKLFPHLFTFIEHEGVEPTNNSSERGIRVAVLWRKICFGNKTDEGAILSARLLTVTRTCWLQERNALEFLVQAISAHRTCSPPPSLLSQNEAQAA